MHTSQNLVALSLALVIIFALSSDASAFCGMYVSGATSKLYNNATQVTLMREGTTTVLSMRNNYQGPPKDFAMVVPVPVVLKEENVRTLPHDIFDKIDALGAPRLVEYWEQDPCNKRTRDAFPRGFGLSDDSPMENSTPLPRGLAVRVEARFKKGEYDITILSATESNALESWLLQNKYNIPKGASKVLKGYIQQGMYFFVAKVDPKKVKLKKGQANLSPLQFHYDSKDFSLPVRLGLLNANGKQDLIVNILAKRKRYEVANHKNVTIPTNLIVKPSVKKRFAEFYASLFDYTLKQNPGAVVTEYAWESAKCDPCPSGNFGGRNISGPLSAEDLFLLGLSAMHPHREIYTTSISISSQVTRGPTPEPPGFRGVRQLVYEKAQQCAFELFGDQNRRNFAKSDVKFKVMPYGKSYVVSARGDAPSGEALAKCLTEKLKTIDLAMIKRLGTESTYTVQTHVSARSDIEIPPHVRSVQGWVLTRLHARYDKKSLKNDLIFKAVRPIAGGRGIPSGEGGELSERGSQKSRSNNFQGRYVILNRWTKKTTCSQPRRGRWGFPRGQNAVAVQDTAFVRRGKFRLKRAITSKNVPGLPFTKRKKKK